MKNIKWLCLKIDKNKNGTMTISVQGIFSTEQNAINACKDMNYFIGPLEEDVEIVEDLTGWTGSYFPRA